MATPGEVTIPAKGGAPATPAFAALPAGVTRGVVVIHEIFGRQPEIDRVVERFGVAGYAAVAPDLFHRGRGACLKDVFRAMLLGPADAARSVPILQGQNARAWLCEEAGIDAARVGLVGFCFGGGYALLAGAGWAAVSTNYGMVPPAAHLRGIGAVIGCYGTRDRSMAKSPGQLRRRLASIGHEAPEIHSFDAGHSFLTDAKPTLAKKLIPAMHIGDYPEAREEGWKRIFAFLDARLA